MKGYQNNKSKNKASVFDYFFVLCFPFIAAFITIYFNTPQIVSLLLFFILPSIFLTIRRPSVLKKGLIMAFTTIPFVVLIDHFAIKDGSWWVPTIFTFRILDNIPIEDFIWGMSWFYYVIAFYEYFIDKLGKDNNARINKRYKTLLIGWYGCMLLFLFFYPWISTHVYIPYFYAIFALVLGIVPLILTVVRRKEFLYKLTIVVLYFFLVNFLHEISALSTNQWYFPGKHFIGWVQIFQFRFPFEEFALWMILGAPYVISWYEYFIDDGR